LFEELRLRLVLEVAVWSRLTVTVTDSPAAMEEEDGVTTIGITPVSGCRSWAGSGVAERRTESAERNMSTCFTKKL
jgi:hypothetical protein